MHDMRKGNVSSWDGGLEKWSWGLVALYYHRNILLAFCNRGLPRVFNNVPFYLKLTVKE